MNKHILLLCCSLFFFTAHSFAQGFTFDKEAYQKREIVESKRGYMPSSYSLKAYTPIIYPQESGNCVAQSYANALGILHSKSLNVTSKDKATLLRPSPFFIYYTNKEKQDFDCLNGLDAEKAALNLLNMGVVPMMMVEYPNYYPFTENTLCNFYPPSYKEDLQYALKFKPTNIYRIETLLDIKSALSEGMPVVIGMMSPPSFKNCRSYVWYPSISDNFDNSYGHAVTVIGYDDNLYGGCFEIMNSWGENWGVNGYTRIKYEDAAKWVVAGWAVEGGINKYNFKYDGGFNEKQDSLMAPDDQMVRIFNEALEDTLAVNPFFQREDLLELYQDMDLGSSNK